MIYHIARDVGLAVTTVYSAFQGGKTEIVEAVHARRLGEMVRAAESYAQSKGPALGRLAASNRQSVAFFMEHENYLRMHLRTGHAWFMPDAVAERVREGAAKWTAGVGAVIEMVAQGIANGEFDIENPRRAGKSIVMLQQLHLAEWIEDRSKQDADEILQRRLIAKQRDQSQHRSAPMREFRDRVCVVTGAASGIGRGLAEKATEEGMKVVLADMAEEPLARLSAELNERGARVASAVTDVGDAASVERLAELAYREFGGVHLLFNNAGVLVDGVSWERSVEDWRWSFDVNVMGVIHGIRSFVPRMLEADEPGVVVNTSSLAGLIVGPFLGPYSATKHAVVGITETLFHEFRAFDAKLRAAVLCPGEVATRIWHSNEQRPQRYGPESHFGSDTEQQFHDQIAGDVESGMTPRELATFVFGALASERFWLFPHPAFKTIYEQRARGILQELDPSFTL